MALLYANSFDNVWDEDVLFDSNTYNPYSPSTGAWQRYNTYSLVGAYNNSHNFTINTSGSDNVLMIQFFVGANTDTGKVALRFKSAPTDAVQFVVRFDAVIKHKRLRAVVLDATETTVLGASKFFAGFHQTYIQIKAVSHATTGSVEILADGNQILNLTGINTNPVGSSLLNRHQWEGSTGTNIYWYMSEYLVMDSTGTAFNALSDGSLGVEDVGANAAGTHSDFTLVGATTIQELWGDSYGKNHATVYAESSTVGHKRSANFTDFAAGTTILAAVNYYEAHTDTGSNTVKSFVRISGTDYEHSNNSGATTMPRSFWDVFEVSPATASAWTLSEYNAAEFGIKVEA